jgi:ATP synthase subunit 6
MFNFIFNPLEQFQSNLIFNLLSRVFGESFIITNYTLSVILVMFLIIALINIFSLRYVYNTNAFNFTVLFVNATRQLLKDNVGPLGNGLLPLMITYFSMVLIVNLTGMISGVSALTTSLAVTFFLGLSLVATLNIFSVSLHGVRFLSLFFPSGTPLSLSLLIVPIEIVSYSFRVISLSVRLFANIMAGHTLLKVIAGFSWAMFQSTGLTIIGSLLPFIAIIILLGLEFAVAVIQAYVFITLATMYFKDGFLLH